MIKDEYSPFKMIHHPVKLQQMREGKQTYPIQVQIVPSNMCNQRCSFCTYRMKDYMSNQRFDGTQMLSFEKVVECLDSSVEMKIKAIQYTGGGEPLVHPDICDIIKATFDRNFEVALVSNGVNLTEEMCDILGDASWTRISVDSGFSESYSRIRSAPLGTFDKVIENIGTLVKYRRSNTVGVGFVVTKDNYKEIYQAATLFKNMNVDNFRISAALTSTGYEYFRDFVEEAKIEAKKAEELSDGSFTVFNLFDDRIEDTFRGTQDYDFCPAKEIHPFIGADYNVYTCCTIAYNDRGLIGSIRNRSLRDLWDSAEKKEFFAKHSPQRMCNHHCLYRSKNLFINYCIKKGPRHINYA